MKKIFYLIILSLLFCNCDPNCQKLALVNSTSDTIYYRLLTDTVLNKDYYLNSILPFDTVKPNFVKGVCRKGLWEFKINNESKDSTLHIFIFNKSKLSDSIINGSRFKRLDFKAKDLDSINWIVNYK